MITRYASKPSKWKNSKWQKSKIKSKRVLNLTKKDSSKFLQAQSFFNISNKVVKSSYIWTNQWSYHHIIHKSVHTSQCIQKFFISYGLYINKLYVLHNHNNLKILGSCLGVFQAYKAKKKISHYKKKLKDKKPLKNLTKFLIEINKVTHVELCFYNIYLPKQIIEKEAIQVFKKQKHEIFFWQSLQLIYGVFNGYVSSSILAGLIYRHSRRNPRRLAFITYIKRLCDWHFACLSKSEIQGVRLEIKGRFNAKSRAKKQIISTGRVRIHEKSSNVDYARIDAITKFGCLGIKVWLCPKNNKNVINT